MSTLPTRAELLKIAKQALFNLEMSSAVNDGRKTQTRRVILDCLDYSFESRIDNTPSGAYAHFRTYNNIKSHRKAKYEIGDILWLREPARVIDFGFGSMTCKYISDGMHMAISIPERFKLTIGEQSKPTDSRLYKNWIWDKKGIPNGCIKELARAFLRVTSVRVERLQDIGYEDILKEGFPLDYELKAKKTYSSDQHGEVDYEEDRAFEWWINLWDSTAPIKYKQHYDLQGNKWEDNPFVFVYEFERIEYVT